MAFITPSIAAVAPTLRHLPALSRVPPARGAVFPRRAGATMAASSLSDLGRIADIDGGELSLTGRPAFVVNVASECGYTASGYQMMKDLLAKQEPGTNEQIKSFVAARAPGVLIAPKSAVNGSESHPLFTVGKAAFPGDFLYDKSGKPVARFDNSSTLADVTAAIDPLV